MIVTVRPVISLFVVELVQSWALNIQARKLLYVPVQVEIYLFGLRRKAILYLAAAIATAVANGASEQSPPQATAVEAVANVFSTSPAARQERSPLTQQPTTSSVRPLQNSSFEPLRKYFSAGQQRNIDQFLHALSDLASARNRRARLVGILGYGWWPPTVDDLEVMAVSSKDLLCDRYERPEKITVSPPRRSNGRLEITVHEAFMEHGQDRILGKGKKTSIVILIPENDRWVIDEIVSTLHDSGGTRIDKLTELLRDGIKPLRNAEREISGLPPPEVRKANKARE